MLVSPTRIASGFESVHCSVHHLCQRCCLSLLYSFSRLQGFGIFLLPRSLTLLPGALRRWTFLSPLEFTSTGSTAGEGKCRGRRGQVAAFPGLKPQPLLPVAPGASTAERLELYAPSPLQTPALWDFQPPGNAVFFFHKKLTRRVFDSSGKSMNTEY